VSNSCHIESRVRSYSITHPPGLVDLPTQPGWDRLVLAQAGVFVAHADNQSWTIPTHRALCVPDGTSLAVETRRRVAIRCLYLQVDLEAVGHDVRVVTLQPLARELLLEAVASSPMTLADRGEAALITVLTEQLAGEPDEPLHLPFPLDPVAKNLAAAIVQEPAMPLEEVLRAANASRRTMERRFASETGMTLGQWRRRARILAAVSMLADGSSVTRVAIDIGYASPSSFVAAFRAELDTPPGKFMLHDRT
jgi:AraC-like DNA-binding protein